MLFTVCIGVYNVSSLWVLCHWWACWNCWK